MIKAEYVDHMGDDLRVVNAARVSFDKESHWVCCPVEPDMLGNDSNSCTGECYGGDYNHPQLSEGDARLISYLAKHNHWTPFSHAMITMRETVPIFVARQRWKHEVGFCYSPPFPDLSSMEGMTINEVSRRYVDDTPEFFYPDVWRGKPTNGAKQGSSDVEIEHLIIEGPHKLGTALFETDIHAYYQDYINDCINTYEIMIEDGVAPEQARMVLPQSMLTSYYVTGSLAAWARAYKLRIDPHAQKEIRDLAVQWGEIIEPLFPVSWKALTC